MTTEPKTSRLRIDSEIGKGPKMFSAADMAAFLDGAGGAPIEVEIHSEGGSVYEGMAIYDLVANYAGPTKAVIRSMAFSIASFIPLAFDEIEIAPNGWLFLHNPFTEVVGSEEQLRQELQQLQALGKQMIDGYVERMNVPEAAVKALLDANTYIDAAKAVELRLADRITGEQKISARKVSMLAKLPRHVASALFGDPQAEKEPDTMATGQKVPATIKAIRAALPKARDSFVIKCMEKEMAMEEVQEEYVEEVLAQLAAMEQENKTLTEVNAKAMEEVEQLKAKVAAMEEEQTATVGASAKYRAGVSAQKAGTTASAGATGKTSFAAQWRSAVKAKMDAGLSRDRAILSVERENPELREQFLSEIKA